MKDSEDPYSSRWPPRPGTTSVPPTHHGKWAGRPGCCSGCRPPPINGRGGASSLWDEGPPPWPDHGPLSWGTAAPGDGENVLGALGGPEDARPPKEEEVEPPPAPPLPSSAEGGPR